MGTSWRRQRGAQACYCPAGWQPAGSILCRIESCVCLFAGMPAQPTPEVYSATEGEQAAPTPKTPLRVMVGDAVVSHLQPGLSASC